MLATSLADLEFAENLAVEASFDGQGDDTVEFSLSLLLGLSSYDESLCDRLTSITQAPGAIRALQCGKPELTLAAAWQLALAMGGTPSIEMTADRKLHVQLSLPLETRLGESAKCRQDCLVLS